MKKWNILGIFNAISISLIAQDSTLTSANESSSSATTYIIIGAIVLILVIYILYSRQKRKFND